MSLFIEPYITAHAQYHARTTRGLSKDGGTERKGFSEAEGRLSK
jgi:hypothetical protein